MGEPRRIPGIEPTAPAAHLYTPSTTGALERMVKLLNQYYPRCTAGDCRESLALMYGYESWSALEVAATCGGPSARDRYAIPADDHGFPMSVRVELLPRALVIWLERQRPRMSGLADRMAGMRVRQHSQCDLLNFAFVWGEACISHPTDIPEALQIYPLALCAKWYGWNACVGAMPAFPVTHGRGLGQRKVPAVGLVLDPTLEHQHALLRAQPREDVAALSVPARERQMEAGYALLRQHIQDAAASRPIGSFISKPAWNGKVALAARALN